MTGQTRRSAIKALLSFGGFAPLVVPRQAEPQRQTDIGGEAREHRQLGLEVIRFVNTVEVNSHRISGAYVPLKELVTSVFIKQWDKAQAQYGALMARLRLDQEEIVPGWKCRLTITQSGYVVTLDDVSTHGLRSLASDETGIIHDSDGPIGNRSLARLSDIPGVQRLGPRATKPTWYQQAQGYVASLTGMAASSQYQCWECYPHFCACSVDICCISGCPAPTCKQACEGIGCGTCINCGCGSCPWVCCWS